MWWPVMQGAMLSLAPRLYQYAEIYHVYVSMRARPETGGSMSVLCFVLEEHGGAGT